MTTELRIKIARNYAWKLCDRFDRMHLLDECESAALFGVFEAGSDSDIRTLRRQVGKHVGRTFKMFKGFNLGDFEAQVAAMVEPEEGDGGDSMRDVVSITLNAIPKREGAYLRRAYGVGRPPMSVKAIAKEYGTPRMTATRFLERAKESFRAMYEVKSSAA